MADFLKLKESFDTLDRGTARLKGIRSAVEEADRAGAVQWQFRFRFDYVEESIFCGDRYHGLVMFPELLQLFETREELHASVRNVYHMLLSFRWILEASSEFPQITRAEVDDYLRRYRQLLGSFGKSPNAYHLIRSYLYLRFDPAVAFAEFFRYLETPMDDASDGKLYGADHQVLLWLSMGEEEKALHAAQRLFTGKRLPYGLPDYSYHKFLRYYMDTGRYDDAAGYAEKLAPRISGDPYYLYMHGTLMSYYALTQPQQGIDVLTRHYPFYTQSLNPWQRMLFAIGAVHLLSRMPDAGVLPQLGQAEALLRMFRAQAEQTAAALDSRDGTGDYMQLYRGERYILY